MKRTPLLLLLLLTGYAGQDTFPEDARDRIDVLVDHTLCEAASVEEIARTSESTTYTCRLEHDPRVVYTVLVADRDDVLDEGLRNLPGSRVQGKDYVAIVEGMEPGGPLNLPQRLGQG